MYLIDVVQVISLERIFQLIRMHIDLLGRIILYTSIALILYAGYALTPPPLILLQKRR